MKNFFFPILLMIFTINAEETVLALWSETAILIDYTTEQILFEKNKDVSFPPASMTKLLTLYMTYREIEDGNVHFSDIVPISSRADYKNLPRDSSLMFLEKGQHVTLYELMLGLAIPSGNDAAIAIAEYLYGSVENYMDEVRREITNLGFKNLQFIDSSGFNDSNSITAAEYGEFCLLLIKKYPTILEDLLSIDSFTYPKPENGYTSIGGIKQNNHNPIVNIYPGCDGLKTGFINKSGLNIALTASDKNRRVIAILGGVKDSNRNSGETKRIVDSVSILNFGLNNFRNITLDKIQLPTIRVKSGNNYTLTPVIPFKRIFTYYLNATISYDITEIEAPVSSGERLGNVKIEQNGFLYEFPIYSNRVILKN